MDTQILSRSARILDRQGYETQTGVEVAIWEDESPEGLGDHYIRVGSTLLWRKDVLENDDRLECLASGMTILL
jgi:hypothetical protein